MPTWTVAGVQMNCALGNCTVNRSVTLEVSVFVTESLG